VKSGRRHQLSHEDHDQVFFGIHPEDSRGRSTPVIVAAAECASFDLSERHREAEPEAYSFIGGFRECADRHLAEILAAREVVKMHQLDRARSQDAHPVQLAAAPQHFAEAQVIGRRTGQSSAAREECRLLQIVTPLRIVDEFETHLGEAQHQCDKQRAAYERVARILIHVKAGIEHLYDKLSIFKTDMPSIAMNDDSVVDVLKQCEAKLMLLLEETAAVADKGMDPNHDALASAAAGSVLLPPNNQRIRIPTGDEDDGDLEDEDEGDDEDVLDRSTIKKMAGLAVQRETRKQRKRVKGGRGRKEGKGGADFA